jgi:predicted dehydrogenase
MRKNRKKEKKIKISILGCGRVALHYLKLFKKNKIKNYKIVSACDIDKKKRNFFSKKLICKNYESLEIMLKETKPDIVLILTPSGMHFDHCKKILNNNCNVICEKPLSMSEKECKILDRIAKKRKLMLGVVFQNRLNPTIQILKKYLEAKKFGRIVSVSVSLIWCRYQSYYNDNWHGTWSNDGGVTNQQAIHHIDILNWLLGPITSISSIMTKRANKLQAEDTMASVFKLKNGALGTIEATTAARPKDFHASLSIVGTKGHVKIGGIAMNKIETWEFAKEKKKISNYFKKKYSQIVPSGYGLSHEKYLNIFIGNLLKNKYKAPPVSAEDAAKTQRLIHAIYSSNEKRKWIKTSRKAQSSYLGR